MTEEGYVKYRAEHRYTPATEPFHWQEFNWEELNETRTGLHDLGLIGVLPNGVGYGNVSIRVQGDQFLISGTATGATRVLSPDQYCLVVSFDVAKNRVESAGPIQASSESMTHGAIYRASALAQCVIHIHSKHIWDAMLRDKYCSTPDDAAYGTPEMAWAIVACVQAPGKNGEGLIVLAGHEDGVIAYGASVGRTAELIRELYGTYCA
jgi:ribulose-5-phosphate 4-epimerase/fuculose-1-phosphate aldolase